MSQEFLDVLSRLSAKPVLIYVRDHFNVHTSSEYINRDAIYISIVSSIPAAYRRPLKKKFDETIEFILGQDLIEFGDDKSFCLTDKGISYLLEIDFHALNYLSEFAEIDWSSSERDNKKAEQDGGASEIPAADRFVSREDNVQAFEDAISALDELDQAVAGANGLTQDADHTTAIRAELRGYRDWLSLPKVRAVALAGIERGIQALKTIAIKVEAKLVEQAADRVVALVLQLLTGG
jgi:hypothetical protein